MTPEPPGRPRALVAAARSLQVTTQDVVELCGVRPWTVTQWRKRADHPFPAPTAGGRSPRFALDEVLAWLDAEVGVGAVEPTPRWWWRRGIDALPAATPPEERGELRPFVAALVVLGAAVHGHLDHLDHSDRPGHRARRAEVPVLLGSLRKTALLVEREHPGLRGLVATGLDGASPAAEVVAVLAGALDLAFDPALDPALDAPSAAAGPGRLLDDALAILGDLAPGAPVSHLMVADLMARLTAGWPAATVVDPACGEAVVATCRAARLPVGGDPPMLLAVELDHAAATVADIRLILAGVPAEVRRADALAGDVVASGAFDLVLLDPPTGSSSGGLGRWLALAVDALAPTGRAVIALPAGALQRGAAAAGLVRQRQVAAVVLLPSGVRAGARDAQALAVVGAASGGEDLLVVDLRSLRPADPVGDGDAIVELVDGWLEDPEATGAVLAAFTKRTHLPARRVSARQVLAEGVVEAGAVPPPREVADSLGALRAAIAEHPELPGAAKLLAALRAFARANDLPDPR